MEKLNEYFQITFKDKFMTAELHCTETFKQSEEKLNIDEETWKKFLADKKVVFGIQYQVLKQLVEDVEKVEFPITIAKGLEPEKGEDGKIAFFVDLNPEMVRDEDWDFREVMKIPSVTKGQKLAKLIKPTAGRDGRNVKGETVKAIPGKMPILRPGKNVVFKELTNTFYAAEDGEISYSGRKIEVLPIFELNETLSLKTGNLDFVGSIIIRGDVPAGFKVQAGGDIKIFGMVEAAEIIANGSIIISEGIAGQGKGLVKAGGNLQTGYINQGNVIVGNDLYVEHSILHSDCQVEGHVFSQKGNIIGGKLIAGKSIEAKDIGSRLNIKTEVALGASHSALEREASLLKKRKEMEEMIQKLKLLGKKLDAQSLSDAKMKIHKLRQQHSLQIALEELEQLNEELSQLQMKIANLNQAELIVRNYIYQNVTVSFGKYKRMMKSDHHYVKLTLEDNEITIRGMD